MVWLTACALAAARPNIVLITLDTTRADRMGFLGSKRGLTPNLDVLAGQSAVFTHAYSQAPLTSVSHATILTGTYPQYHQVLDFPMPLVKDVPYGPDLLHSQGYQTAAIIGSIALDPSGAPGFARGFDTYDATFQHRAQNKTRYETAERRAGDVVFHALKWLNEHPKGPFFLWVHFYDPHDPYDPPEPFKTKYASQPYDGEIAYMDSALGDLFRELKTRDLYDNAMIAVMADHGESLGEHGEETHGVFLYDETIHVPLLIKLPHGAGHQQIENRVELVDVMPTILQVAGTAVPAEVQGISLLSLINAAGGDDNSTAETWRDRAAYAEADYGRLAYGWSALQSLRAGKYLYVQAPRRELYDQTADPPAEHNLASQSAAVADTLAARLEAFRQRTVTKREMPTVITDPATQEKLASLGYISSTGKSPSSDALNQGADPKDKIATANGIRRVNFLIESAQFGDAVPVLEQLVAKDPGVAVLYAKLGGCYMKLHQYDKAVPVLRKAVDLEPTLTVAQMDLGKSLLRVEDFDGAAVVFETLVARMPTAIEAQLLLEGAYASADRVPETIRQCRRVLSYLPDHYRSHLILGEFLAKSGDAAAGLPELRKASELRPNDPQAHAALAVVYDELGLKTDAERERAQAESLSPSSQED